MLGVDIDRFSRASTHRFKNVKITIRRVFKDIKQFKNVNVTTLLKVVIIDISIYPCYIVPKLLKTKTLQNKSSHIT